MPGLKSGPISEAEAKAGATAEAKATATAKAEAKAKAKAEATAEAEATATAKAKLQVECLRSPTIARSGGLRMGHPGFEGEWRKAVVLRTMPTLATMKLSRRWGTRLL
jgi:hypothetical protein